MAEQDSLSEEEEVSKKDKPVTVCDRLDEIIGLVEQQREDEVMELLRYPYGLLHEACSRESVDSVKMLLERSVSTAEWDKSFLLPLHIVARRNLLEVAKVLLNHDSEGVDRPSKFGETPLHFACLKGHKEMAELLIKFKANVERRDHCGNTCLHYAVGSDNPELVEWLLRDKNMYQLINTMNTFHDTPIHRAAVLQCVKVIPILIKYRVKLSNKDKNNFTAFDIASILYNNEKVTVLPNGDEERELIVPPPSAHKRLPSYANQEHFRSSSFSTSLGMPGVLYDGSTTSLPNSGGLLRKKPSATQSKRPVNLTFSNGYSRQMSGVSSGSSSVGGSRGSGIYLRDKDHANRLSQVLDKHRSNEDVHKIVLDQTAYELPVDMYFVGEGVTTELSNSNPRLVVKEHDIRIKVNEQYWAYHPSSVVQCRLAASLHWNHAYPSGHVFISPICFLSCRAKWPLEVRITLPHALADLNEANVKKLTIFFSPTISSNISSPSPQEFHRMPTPDLSVDAFSVSFTATLSNPTLFVVGFATAPLTSTGGVSLASFPVARLRCCLYVASPSDQDQYLTNTDIWVYVAMNLKTVETAMKKHVVPHDFSLEEKRFFLSGPVISVNGELENDPSDWQSSRRGKGLFRYTQVALSPDCNQEIMSHHETYPAKEAFFIECHNPKRSLKFRVSVVCDNNELVNMLVTPYTPPKIATRLGMVPDVPGSPQDTFSSIEDIPLRTSSV